MTTTKTLIFISIAAAFLPALAMAQQGPRIPGYLTDTSGKVVKNNYGECWHAGFWTPAMAIAECDPSLIKKTEAPVAKLAAATPEAAPAPAPTPAPVRQKVALQKVSFSADALFAFDKSTLKPEGMLALDGLAMDLDGVQYDTIQVTGNTDRIGSTKYNQKLSEQRANAVQNYLVSKNIAANRILVVGKGEMDPITKPGDCTGPKSRKLIACLQPDRRVDVEVSGTK